MAGLRLCRGRAHDVLAGPAVLRAGSARGAPRADRRDHRPALDPLPAHRARRDLGERGLRGPAARGGLVRRSPRLPGVRVRGLPLCRATACSRGAGDPQHVGRGPQRRRPGGGSGPGHRARRGGRRPGPRCRRARRVALVAAQRSADPPRPPARDGGRPPGGPRALPRARGAGVPVRQPPPAARQRRDTTRVAAPQCRDAARPGRLDVRPRLPPEVACAVRRDARDDAWVGAGPRMAGGGARRVRTVARARCHLDLLRPVLVLVRAQLQPAPGRPADAEGDRLLEPGRRRTRYPVPGPAWHVLRRDAHGDEGACPGLHVGAAQRRGARRRCTVPRGLPAGSAQRQRERAPAWCLARLHRGAACSTSCPATCTATGWPTAPTCSAP